MILIGLLVLIIVVVTIVVVYFSDNKYTPIEAPIPDSPPVMSNNYKGLCIFDIDGTLTMNTSDENEILVNYALDKGYAVGICTAGSVYNRNNLLSYDWMPRNLYDFMEKINFVTFNNVASGILAGKDGKQYYDQIGYLHHINWGYKKGLALEVTAYVVGVKDSEVIMFDNDPFFIAGITRYNPNYKVICVGEPCGGGDLDIEKMRYAFSSWV